MKSFLRTKTVRLPCPFSCGVISDTHASFLAPQYLDAIRHHFAGMEYVIHLGDVVGPAVISEIESLGFVVLSVLGNNDRLLNSPQILFLECGPWRIGATHGGGGGYQEVARRALRQIRSVDEEPLHALLHGHSHMPTSILMEDLPVFNPGSLGYPRTWPGVDTPDLPSMGKMVVTPEGIHFDHVFLENCLTS